MYPWNLREWGCTEAPKDSGVPNPRVLGVKCVRVLEDYLQECGHPSGGYLSAAPLRPVSVRKTVYTATGDVIVWAL